MKIMVSGPITWWQIDGETVEVVRDFIFLSSKITADGNCSHKIKRRLLLGRKTMTNLDSILKSRDMTLLTKIRLVKAVVFPVVIYRCKSWAINKAKCWRLNAFKLWCWADSWESLGQQGDQMIKPVNHKGNQPWIFIGRTEVETPILWSPDVKSRLIGEDPLEKGMATHSSMLAWRISILRGAWQATVHGLAKSWTQLSN